MFNTKLLARYRWVKRIVIILLVLLLVFVGWMIYVENQDYLLKDYWLKLITIFLGVAIAAIIDIGGFLDDKKQLRKSILYCLFGSLLVFTVWNTTNESISDRKAEIERDSLIKVDSLRFDRIVKDFTKNIHKLDSISGQVLVAFDEVINIKKGISEQKPILGTILNNTSESFKETESLIEANAPNLLLGSSRTTAHFDHDGSLMITLFPANLGFGVAKNAKVFYQVFYATVRDTATKSGSFRLVGPKGNPLGTYPKEWTKLEVDYFTPSMGSGKNRIHLRPSLNKSDFLGNKNYWFVIYSTMCSDYRDETILKSIVIDGELNEAGGIDLFYNRLQLEPIKEYLERHFEMGEYVFLKK